MRVGLIVAANKHTGAGAVAELSCRALRAAAIDSRLLFIGGRNLEKRLDRSGWASPSLVRERTPLRAAANLQAIRKFVSDVDVIVSHLPHDHLLCVGAGVHRRVPLVRAFRNPRHLRRDPYHHFLHRRLSAAIFAYSNLGPRSGKNIAALPSLVLPVPVEDRFKPSDGHRWRQRLDISKDAPVIGMVGKMARDRGFETLLEIAALTTPAPQVLAVGHGEARASLEDQAARLGINHRVCWAGYQEDALPELYAAMDIVLFTAPGSDWGHRAISEAQACARPVVAEDISGVEDLVKDGVTGRIVSGGAESMAPEVSSLLCDRETASRLGKAAADAARDRRVIPSGRRLAEFLERVVASGAHLPVNADTA
jgi:glycosyltransferase involved in cell wall biosynthesis